MRISIKLYGDMKKYAAGKSNLFELVIEPGANFKEILKVLDIADDNFVFLVNGRRIEETYHFKKGDILVMFPKISDG